MIQLLKKRRSQWILDKSNEVTEHEILQKQVMINNQEKRNIQFWSEKDNQQFLNKRSNLYSTQRKIDLGLYEERENDERDVIVIPKAAHQVINLEEESVILSQVEDNLVIIDEEQERDNNQGGLQIDKMNGNLLNLNFDKDIEISSDRMINDTFQAVKDDVEEEQKVQQEQSSCQEISSVGNKTILVNHFISGRKFGLTDKQPSVEEGQPKKQKETLQALNIDEFSDKYFKPQKITQVGDVSFMPINPPDIPQINQQPEKAIIIEEEKNNEEVIRSSQAEQEEQEENQLWYHLKNPQQVSITYFANWGFKGQDKVNIDYGKNYEASAIFKMLFTQQMYSHLIQNIYSKFQRRIQKKNVYEEPLEINSYDIDAFFSLLLHYECLSFPNQINTINKNNEVMDLRILDFIMRNFSIGAKNIEENNENTKVSQFLSMVNEKLEHLVSPKEYLQLLQKTIEGNYFKNNSQYNLDEFRLYDFSYSFIVNIKFLKTNPKTPEDYDQQLLLSQADMLDQYRDKNHKVVVQNQIFDAPMLKKLRDKNIGVVAKCNIKNIEFTRKQQEMISQNILLQNFFFFYEQQVQAVVTPYSFSHQYAFISNYLGLEFAKDLANPKMQQVYSEKGVILDYKDILSRDVEGLKWNMLVFLRVLDVLVKNTHALYQYINNDPKITREQIIKDLKRQFLQSYQGHRTLQHKISVEKISKSNDFRVHFWEENQGGKKQECIVCRVKTRNHCIQCSEKKKQIIGFCGSSNCLQKHNELPARLLNQQSDNIGDKRKNPYDRPYESATESGGGFKNKFGSRFLDTTSKEGSPFKSLGSKKFDGGYQSEATSSIKQRNFSVMHHDDGFKSDAGTSSHMFSGKKKSSQGSYTFKTTHQLAKEHESQFNSTKNLHSRQSHSQVSLADELLNVYQKKKTISSNIEKNSQEPPAIQKDKEDEKNNMSGTEKQGLKVKDFSQLKSKGSLSDIEGQASQKDLDPQKNVTQEHKEKRKRQSKVPWYNDQKQQEEDLKQKQIDQQNAQSVFKNPKVRDMIYKDGFQQQFMDRRDQHQNNHHHHLQNMNKPKQKIYQFEQEDNSLQKIPHGSIQNEMKSVNPNDSRIKKELTNSQQQSFQGFQNTPTLGVGAGSINAGLNQSMSFNVPRDKIQQKDQQKGEQPKKYTFEEEDDDISFNEILTTPSTMQKQKPSQQSNSQGQQLNENNEKKKIPNSLGLETNQSNLGNNSQGNQVKKYQENEKQVDGFFNSLLSSSTTTATAAAATTEIKGKQRVEGIQKIKSISKEKGEPAISGLIKIQKETIQKSADDIQFNQSNKEDQSNKQILDSSSVNMTSSKLDLNSQDPNQQKSKRQVIKAYFNKSTNH